MPLNFGEGPMAMICKANITEQGPSQASLNSWHQGCIQFGF